MGDINIIKIDSKLDFSKLKFWKWFKKEITKINARILFVDDQDYPVVDNLKKAGWGVDLIRDIDNLQNEKVQKAHIIFVDHKGVGKELGLTEEGMGLAKALKETYGKTKRIILYSGYGRFKLDKSFILLDNQMSKEADTYDFINMIESELKKI